MNRLPATLSVNDACILLNRPVRTVNRKITDGIFDLPCTDPEVRPRRVQTRAVLAHTGLTADEALTILTDQEVAA